MGVKTRKVLAMAMTLALLVTMFVVPGAAEEQKDGVTSGLNVIILMDCSKSVSYPVDNGNPASGADKDCMRYDAAAMLINLCDEAYSQVAVVPFQNKVIDSRSGIPASVDLSWVANWESMSNEANRRKLCNGIFGLYEVCLHVSGKTNISVAFDAANKLADEIKADNTNNTIVLLLTDGVNSEDVNNDIMTVKYAEELREKGVEIFTILLQGTGMTDVTRQKAKDLCFDITGSKANVWMDVRPDDLKERFSTLFAQKIGTKTKQIQLKDAGNQIVADFRVPNDSTEEMNIVLPCAIADLGSSSISISRKGANDTKYTEVSANEYYTYTKTSAQQQLKYDFVSIKLTNPAPGEWKVEIPKTQDKSVNFSKFSTIDILYNYDLQLKTDAKVIETKSYASAGMNDVSLSNRISLKAYFVDKDEKPVNDSQLYRMDEKKNSTAIAVTGNVYDKNDKQVQSFVMEKGEGNYFQYLFDPNTINAEDPYGEYRIVVNAEGTEDELYRTAPEFTFTLKNHAPELAYTEDGTSIEFAVNDPFKQQTEEEAAQESRREIQLSKYFVDEDRDELIYSIAKDTDKSSYSDVFSANVEGDKLIVAVKSEAGQQKRKAGTGFVTVLATDDIEGTVPCELRFDLESSSLDKEMQEAKLVIIPSDSNPKKGDTITLSVQVLDAEGNEISGDTLQKIVENGDFKVECGYDAVSAEDGNKLLYSYKVGKNARKYTFSGSAEIGNKAVFYVIKEMEGTSVEVNNEAPTTIVDEKEKKISVLIGDTHDFKPETYFKDSDMVFGEDGSIRADGEVLNYSEEIIEAKHDWAFWKIPGTLAFEAIGRKGAEPKQPVIDSDWKLTPNESGKFKVKFTAEDTDGKSTETVFDVAVQNKTETIIFIAIDVILLAIVIFLVCKLFKVLFIKKSWPRSGSKGSFMMVSKDGITRPNNGRDAFPIGVHGRSSVALSRFVAGTDINDKPEIVRVLRDIEVSPIWRNAFKLELKKKANGLTSAKTGGKDLLNKKKVNWFDRSKLTIVITDDGEPTVIEFVRMDKGDK